MPTNVNAPDTAATKKSSTMTKLVQAAALAVLLVPLGSVALEAAIISSSTCAFYYFGGGTADSCTGGGPTSTTRTFDFDFGTFTLELFGMTGSTDITVRNATLTQSEFNAANAIAEANCIPIAGAGGCRMLWITASNPDAFTGWRQDTFWNFPTNVTYSNGEDPDGTGPQPGLVRVYRSAGDLNTLTGQLNGSFTEDMCLAAIGNPSYTPCEYFPEPTPTDPGIRSGNTDFSVITFVQVQPVPEPSTMLLLGTGVAGLVFRRRRRTTV